VLRIVNNVRTVIANSEEIIFIPDLNNYWIDIKHTMHYILHMKYYSWNNDKNEKLKKERGISFEDVIYYIENEKLCAILKHKNQVRYPGQKIFVVEICNYVYLVPFVETDREIFLKTIIPSRKATKKYLEVNNEI
jgi:uncharacterized DUF497 family protein